MVIKKKHNIGQLAEQMLGDLIKCFGKFYSKKSIVICESCKYKEQCEASTKYE